MKIADERCGNGTDQRVSSVGDNQMSRRTHRNAGEAAKPRLLSRTIGEAGLGTGKRARISPGNDLGDASAVVGHVDDAPGIDSYADGPDESVGRERVERADQALGRNDPHDTVARIGNVYVSCRVDSNATGRVELCIGGRTVGEAFLAARERDDATVRVDRANAIVIGVGDDHAPECVDGDADRSVESRLERRAVRKPGFGGSGERRDGTIRRYASDAVVSGVGDVDRTGRVESQAGWCVETGDTGGAVGMPARAAGNRRHASVGADAPDSQRVAGIGNVDGAVSGDGNAEGIGEPGAAVRAVAQRADAIARDHRHDSRPLGIERIGAGLRSPPPPAGDAGDDDQRRDGKEAQGK